MKQKETNLKTKSDILEAMHKLRPDDQYGYFLIAMMDEYNVKDLRSISYMKMLLYYFKLLEETNGDRE